MVKEIKIQNYKSVQDLTLELGRINVLIGANGCGKSNILEAIAFGAAAKGNKLGNEFLSARGIRITEPKLMRSGFKNEFLSEDIIVSFSTNDNISTLNLRHLNDKFSEWQTVYNNINDVVDKFILDGGVIRTKNQEAVTVNEEGLKLFSLSSSNENDKKEWEIQSEKIRQKESYFYNFLIYAPENTFLRRFEEESQIEPLGIRGEGLFKLLSVMSQETPEEFQEIIENLELIDWFDGFEIPKDLVFTERRIRIKDRFLEEGLQYFDQRSSNEGFLFLMFYFALFISKYTPKFFAIDNIDASLNPKLCIELIKILTKLAKKYDKQVIFTTHNPAILDGLNLNDDEVRLLVVNRNIHGHTKVKRVLKKEMPEGVEPLRLSEQFMRGYLGGLPKNF
jgi:predicted ATPase